MITVLRSSTQVQAALRRLFVPETRGRRRVILVAYVGQDACELLPDFRGVELFCWPQVGATNPYTIAKLMQRQHGAIVRFVDQLHMKVYWVEGEGFVVTSANLSRRALGTGIREELGVFVGDASQLDIDQLIDRLASRPVRPTELKRLQRQHDEYWASLPAQIARSRPHHVPSFLDWYRGDRNPAWKISWWDESGDESPSTAVLARKQHGVDTINEFFPCEAGQLKERDWVLSFRLSESGTVTSPKWGRVDCLNKLTKSELRESDYSFEAVQLRPLSSEHPRPFAIDRAALQEAVRIYGADRIRDLADLRPPKQFLSALAKAYR